MAQQSARLTSDDVQALRELGWNLSNDRAKRFTLSRELIFPLDPAVVEAGEAVQLEDAA